MRAIIVGGGIGGLTTALCLHAAGIKATVYESVSTIRPLGVGINLLPHAVRELTILGLLDELCAIGIQTEELRYFNKFGQQIWQEPRGKAAGYRWPQISIHRGELQQLLLRTVQARLGPDAVRTGHHLAAFEEQNDRVIAYFTERQRTNVIGSTGGDILIGADGIHSVVRTGLYPNEGPPKWNGAILWRGVTESAPFLTGRSMFMAGHASQKFVCYPISQAHAAQGRSLTNWVAEIRFDATTLPRREDWNRQGQLADFLPAFANWRFDWLDIPDLIVRAPAVYEYPMVDRDPVERWSDGHVTLLGDAAHPMYPVGSNGASQAILDARALTDALALQPNIPAALQVYEAERLPATTRIVLSNRQQGPERVMQLAEERAPNGFTDLDTVIPPDERETIAAEYKRIAGFARDALNAKE